VGASRVDSAIFPLLSLTLLWSCSVLYSDLFFKQAFAVGNCFTELAFCFGKILIKLPFKIVKKLRLQMWGQ